MIYVLQPYSMLMLVALTKSMVDRNVYCNVFTNFLLGTAPYPRLNCHPVPIPIAIGTIGIDPGSNRYIHPEMRRSGVFR